ncbi:hypothetical protein HKD37_19G053185 [Glycine soja]
MEHWIEDSKKIEPEMQEKALGGVSSLSSFSIPLPFIFQEAKECIDEEDPRPSSSNGAYIIVNGEGSTPKDPLYKILDELRSLQLWKEKQERKEKGDKSGRNKKKEILKELRKEKNASYSNHNSCKSLSEELRDYYEGCHRSHLRPHSHRREKEGKPQEANINLLYLHGKDNVEANLDWEIRVEQQLKRKSTSKFYGSHSYPKKDQGQGILGVTLSKPKDDKGKIIEKQPLKASMQEKTSFMKCFKCIGRGHITSQCPTKKTMIIRGQEIYSSQDEATTSPSSSESDEAKGEESSEEIYPQEEGQPLMVRDECKEVSVSSTRLAKKERHFEIKTNIKEISPLRQPPYFLLCKKTLVSIAQVKELLDEGLVRKILIPCVLLMPKIGIIRQQIPKIGGMMNVEWCNPLLYNHSCTQHLHDLRVEEKGPEFQEPRELRSNPFQGGGNDAFLPRKGIGFLRFTKSFQTLCFSMATSPKETAASGSPSVPSSPHQEQPEFNIQPIQIIPGQASVPEKLVPRRPQGVKIAENPSPATSPREVDTEMDKKIRSIVSSILKDASVPEADEDVPTSSNPNVSVPDVKKDVPTSSAPNAEALPSPSEEGSTEEDDQAAEETPAPRAPEPAPGNLIDLEEVESDEEPIANRLAPGIAERLQSRKGKSPLKRSGRIKTMAQKKSTPITPATSRRSKVAIPSKKRKEISSSDSDEDVELDVSTSKKAKTSGKKVPGNVPDAPLDNISFHSIGNAERWKFVYQRRLALERELGRAALDCKEIMDLIKAAGLLKTVSKLGDCYEGLVREFIVNIPSDISNRKSDDYQRVFVRGKCVRFSPAVINKYLGRPTDGVIDIDVSEHQIAKEITAKRVQHWPRKGKLSAGKLSVKYAILHRIGAANWVPTNHTSTVATGLGKFLYAVGTKSKFNFGNYIFDQTVKHSESFAVKLPIAFPTVLCGIMLSQHPNMLNYTDSVMKRESPLSLHYKLFEGTHVPDIVSTSVSTSGKAAASGAVSKDALIAELKDTCKVLEATIKATTEKKMELELLIKRLSEMASPLSLPSPFRCHSSSKKQRNPLMKKILGLQAPMELTSHKDIAIYRKERRGASQFAQI